MADELTVEMEFVKDTLTTRVFKENTDGLPKLGTLYVPKATLKYELGNAAPDKIAVTIKVTG